MIFSAYKNAFWNMSIGLSSAILTLAIASLVARSFSQDQFAIWSLAMSIGAIVNYFTFGLPIIAARHVAILNTEKASELLNNQIVATSFWISCSIAMIFIIISGIFAYNVDYFYSEINKLYIKDLQYLIFLYSISSCLLLIITFLIGIFSGLESTRTPAIILIVTRSIALLLTMLSVIYFSLAELPIFYLFYSILTVTILYLFIYRVRHDIVHIKYVSTDIINNIIKFCGSITILNFCILLTFGIDLIVISHFDFPSLPYYSLALTLATFTHGIMIAIANAFVPAAAKMQAQGNKSSLLLLTDNGTRAVMAASILIAVPFALFGDLVISYWINDSYAGKGADFLLLLTVASLFHNMRLIYIAAATGCGIHQRFILVPITEAAVSVGLGIFLAQNYGAWGVGVAKVVATILAMVVLLWKIERQNDLAMSRRQLLAAVFRPQLAWIPIAATMVGLPMIFNDINELYVMALTVLISVFCVSVMTIKPSEMALVWAKIRTYI